MSKKSGASGSSSKKPTKTVSNAQLSQDAKTVLLAYGVQDVPTPADDADEDDPTDKKTASAFMCGFISLTHGQQLSGGQVQAAIQKHDKARNDTRVQGAAPTTPATAPQTAAAGGDAEQPKMRWANPQSLKAAKDGKAGGQIFVDGSNKPVLYLACEPLAQYAESVLKLLRQMDGHEERTSPTLSAAELKNFVAEGERIAAGQAAAKDSRSKEEGGEGSAAVQAATESELQRQVDELRAQLATQHAQSDACGFTVTYTNNPFQSEEEWGLLWLPGPPDDDQQGAMLRASGDAEQAAQAEAYERNREALLRGEDVQKVYLRKIHFEFAWASGDDDGDVDTKKIVVYVTRELPEEVSTAGGISSTFSHVVTFKRDVVADDGYPSCIEMSYDTCGLWRIVFPLKRPLKDRGQKRRAKSPPRRAPPVGSSS